MARLKGEEEPDRKTKSIELLRGIPLTDHYLIFSKLFFDSYTNEI